MTVIMTLAAMGPTRYSAIVCAGCARAGFCGPFYRMTRPCSDLGPYKIVPRTLPLSYKPDGRVRKMDRCSWLRAWWWESTIQLSATRFLHFHWFTAGGSVAWPIGFGENSNDELYLFFLWLAVMMRFIYFFLRALLSIVLFFTYFNVFCSRLQHLSTIVTRDLKTFSFIMGCQARGVVLPHAYFRGTSD
jgi:hypothetical protein